MNGKAVRIAGIAGVVVTLAVFWTHVSSPSMTSLLAGLLAVLALVSPEAVDAFPLGPSK